MRLQDERHTERGRVEDASNINAHIKESRSAGSQRTAAWVGADERATYEDPSELDMETRLAAYTSCERWKVVVAGLERLRRAPPPSTRTSGCQRRTATAAARAAAAPPCRRPQQRHNTFSTHY